MDLYLFRLINQFALQWSWLDNVFVFFAEYFQYIVIAFLFVFLFIKFQKYWEMVVLTIISAMFSRFIVVEIIRWFWQRSRPFVDNNVNLLITHNQASFPSGHASFFFAIATIVYLYNKRIGILFIASAFLISLSRVFCGIHWPSDILAGAVVGIFSGLLINKIWKILKNRFFQNIS
ncbi:MAG: phosphatase PAP2 family protein [Patescibacteria group bacterium]|nr:phosphatase PAP2 family protein [Patescibacteria group bacterium]